MGKLVKRDCYYGDYLLPEYYFTPEDYIEIEKANPGSSPKYPSQKGSDYSCLYLMGQAVFIITQLLTSGFLHINELDPIRRYMPSYNRPRKTGRYSAFQVCKDDYFLSFFSSLFLSFLNLFSLNFISLRPV